MNQSKEKVKFAIVGSGAITEQSYLPVAEMIPNVVVTHLIDLDVERAIDVARNYQISDVISDYREIYGKVDAVIVATPPNSHAKISIDCMNHGLHVLCEKPLASSVVQAREMVETGKRTSMHLAVGMVRRLNWSAQILKKLIGSDLLGNIHGFDIEEGWEFNWPLRTAHTFQAGKSGGVVPDAGSHIFDLLLWIFGSQNARVLSCRDDNWGGVAMNAEVELEIERNSLRTTGKVELSYTRKLRNTMKIYGEQGCLEAETVGANEIYFYPVGENEKPIILKPQNAEPKIRNGDFTLQLQNFACSIINSSKKYVPAEDALTTMALIEECYRLRDPIAQSWDIKHLESFFGCKINGENNG